MPAGQYIATPMDPWIPNPSWQSLNVTQGDGDWDDPMTWTLGLPPIDTDDIRIEHNVTIRDTSAVVGHCLVEANGSLTFDHTVNTKLVCDTLMVLGSLTIGTAANPIALGVTAEIEFRDTPLDIGTLANPGLDPGEYLNGLLGLESCTVRMHGQMKTPFVRCATEPLAGNSIISLEATPTGWQVGDVVSIPDTRQITLNEHPRRNSNTFPTAQWETRTITNVNGAQITLSAPLTFDHLGARDSETNAIVGLPHLINRTRNVKLYSANPAGTRGHTIYQGASDIDVRYTQLTEMGRTKNDSDPDKTIFDGSGNPTTLATNHVARYPFHLHHLYGPPSPQANGRQWTMIGNVAEGPETHLPNFKWGYAIHGAHYGLLQGNISYNMAGAQFVTEDGTEYENIIEGNFAMRASSIGSGWRYSAIGGAVGTSPTMREAAGFWFRGASNRVRFNVSANCITYDQYETAYHFKYVLAHLGNVTIPASQGVSPMVNGVVVDGNAQPIMQFEGNEGYGASENGFTMWWVNYGGPSAPANFFPPSPQPSTIKDLTLWHTQDRTVFLYEGANIAFDGFRSYGSGTTGWWSGDYQVLDITIKNSIIDTATAGGLAAGITTNEAGMGTFLIQDTAIKSCDRGIQRQHYLQTNDVTGVGPEVTELRNVTFYNCGTNIYQKPTVTPSLYNVAQLMEMRVFDYNGTPGDDFQCYFSWQEPADIMLETIDTRHIGAPVIGQTNQHNWDNYRFASAGSLAPPDADSSRVAQGVTGLTGRRNDLISAYKANATLDRRERTLTGPWVEDMPAILTVPGSTDSIQVVLKRQPTANVTVPFVSDDTNVATVSPASVTFTPSNWFTPQTVTVTGGGTTGTAKVYSGAATSSDVRYSGYIARTDRAGDYFDVTNSAAAPLLYDLGSASSPTLAGHQQVDPADAYDIDGSGGYGFAATGFIDSRDRGAPDDLRRDFIFRADGDWKFIAHVPPGSYTLKVIHGDQNAAGFSGGTITVNGQSVVLAAESTPGVFVEDTASVTLANARIEIDFDTLSPRVNGIELTSNAPAPTTCAHNNVLDAALNVVITADQLLLNTLEPADRSAAIADALGSVVMASGDYTGPVNGDVSGRKITVAGKGGVSATKSGTVNHVALVDASTLLIVTTCTGVAMVAGDALATGPWDVEIGQCQDTP